MCSGCSGDYCSGFEEPDFLQPKYSGSSNNAALHFGQGSSKRRASDQHHESAHRDPDPDRAETYTCAYKPDELARPYPRDAGTSEMHCHDDYEILVSATQITEIRRIGRGSSAAELTGSSAIRAGHGCFQSAAPARWGVKYYQTSNALRQRAARTATPRLMWFLLMSLAAIPLVRLLVWLMLR
jgi:hypothetical protein